MTAPDLIPIMYETGDRTGSIGTYQHGFFLGSIMLIRSTQHWYAALHLFDHEARHTSSDIWDAGAHVPGSAAVADRADAHLAERVQDLPGAQRRDIAVRPFQLTRDGITFGLILGEDPEFGDRADLVPNGLRFHAPWDGDYDT